MRIEVQKWGNSLALRIPKPFAEEVAVREGTVVNLSVSEGTIVVVPLKRRKHNLRQLLEKVRKTNLHAEVSYGKPIGREIW